MPLNSVDIEKSVDKWVRGKYKKIQSVHISKIWKEGDLWSVDLEVEFKSGIISSQRTRYSLQVGTNGQILGYREVK